MSEDQPKFESHSDIFRGSKFWDSRLTPLLSITYQSAARESLSPTEVQPGREVAERADGRVVAFVGEQPEPVAAEVGQLGEAGGGAWPRPLHLLHGAVHLESRLGRPPVHRLPGTREIVARLG